MPGLPVPGRETAHFVIGGNASAGCSFIDGGFEISVDRKHASFAVDTQIAGYETSVEAGVDLSDWPSFEGRGKGRGDMVKDVLEAVTSEVEARAKSAHDKAEALAKKKKKELEERRRAVEDAVDEARAKARQEVQQKIDAVADFAGKQGDRFKSRPAIRTAWEAAERAAKRMKLARDNTIEGAKEAREAVTAVARNARGEVKDAADDARGRIDAAVNAAKSIPDRVQALPKVKAARDAVAQAEQELRDFRATLMKEKIDPLAVAASDVLHTITIDEVGFDSGIEALCKGKLPMLTVKGSFAGKPFDLAESLQLATKRDFRNRNRKNLEAVGAKLLAMMDDKTVTASVGRMGAE